MKAGESAACVFLIQRINALVHIMQLLVAKFAFRLCLCSYTDPAKLPSSTCEQFPLLQYSSLSDVNVS